MPGRVQEEPRGGEKEREREGGGVGGSHRDPLEKEPHGFCRPACVRTVEEWTHEAVERNTKETSGARGCGREGGSDSRK